LAVNDGMIVFLLKYRWRNLPAQVTVDAGVIYEEIAGNVFGVRTIYIGHIDSLPVGASMTAHIVEGQEEAVTTAPTAKRRFLRPGGGGGLQLDRLKAKCALSHASSRAK